MIVIYNLWALLVGAVIAFAGLMLYTVAPAAFSEANAGWTIGLLVTVFGGGAEVAGLRARLFFLPIWLFGTIVLGFTAYGHVGIVAFIIPLGSVVLGICWMVRSSNKRQAQHWAKAKESIITLKDFVGDTATIGFWILVKESLHFPQHGDLTQEILSHNLQVTQSVLAKARLANNDLVAWDALETYLKRNLAKPRPDSMDYVLAQHLGNLIDAQIKAPTRPITPPPISAAA